MTMLPDLYLTLDTILTDRISGRAASYKLFEGSNTFDVPEPPSAFAAPTSGSPMATSFNGLNSFVFFAHAPAFRALTFWACPESVAEQQFFLCRLLPGKERRTDIAVGQKGGRLRIEFGDEVWRAADRHFHAGAWTHVAVVFAAEGVQVYVDGNRLSHTRIARPEQSGVDPWSLAQGHGPLFLGANPDLTMTSGKDVDHGELRGFFDGSLDGVGLWHWDDVENALDEGAIRDLVNSGPPPLPELPGEEHHRSRKPPVSGSPRQREAMLQNWDFETLAEELVGKLGAELDAPDAAGQEAARTQEAARDKPAEPQPTAAGIKKAKRDRKESAPEAEHAAGEEAPETGDAGPPAKTGKARTEPVAGAVEAPKPGTDPAPKGDSDAAGAEKTAPAAKDAAVGDRAPDGETAGAETSPDAHEQAEPDNRDHVDASADETGAPQTGDSGPDPESADADPGPTAGKSATAATDAEPESAGVGAPEATAEQDAEPPAGSETAASDDAVPDEVPDAPLPADAAAAKPPEPDTAPEHAGQDAGALENAAPAGKDAVPRAQAEHQSADDPGTGEAAGDSSSVDAAKDDDGPDAGAAAPTGAVPGSETSEDMPAPADEAPAAAPGESSKPMSLAERLLRAKPDPDWLSEPPKPPVRRVSLFGPRKKREIPADGLRVRPRYGPKPERTAPPPDADAFSYKVSGSFGDTAVDFTAASRIPLTPDMSRPVPVPSVIENSFQQVATPSPRPRHTARLNEVLTLHGDELLFR
ncbi:MAG: LamG-like jellyroll fold domain-containing protein [Paracoccaceae bacterium]